MPLGRLIVCLGLVLSLSGAAPAEDVRGAVAAIAAPYRFDAVRWMVSQWVRGGAYGGQALDEAPAALVWRYLAITREIEGLEQQRELAIARETDRVPAELDARLARLRENQRSMQPGVERTLTSQIRSVLIDLGIRSPADGWAAWTPFFPPISFRIENPPHLLVVSPRDRIESVAQITLVQDLDLATALDIESEVEALGYSALVTGIGGFGGTYPTFVAESSSLRWIVETATEEWFHQYLAFTPVGSRYVLHLVGWRPDYEIARINETVAGFVASEVADQVLDRYYGGEAVPAVETVASEFDYTRFMRETRLTVDRLLADGEVEAAETYMEARRQELVARGYAIRKLNQAYFAFHGTYTYGPAAVDPIYEEIKLLRAKSPSLSAFVQAAARLTSRAHLRSLLELPAPEQASVWPRPGPSLGACARIDRHGRMGA